MGVDLPRRLNQLGQDFQVVLVRGKSRVLYQIAIDNRILVISSLNLLSHSRFDIELQNSCVGDNFVAGLTAVVVACASRS